MTSSYGLWRKELPTITPYYAVKSNPDPTLISHLASLGSGFDCASGRELMEVGKLGLSSSDFKRRVVYANPCKPQRDLETAQKLGSPTTVVDSFEEIEKLEDSKWQGSTLIRLLVEDKNSLMPFSRKFGIHPSKVKSLSEFAKKRGIDVMGVSFHVGSGCRDKTQYEKALQSAHTAIAEIRSQGFQPNLIDIGGGFTMEPGSVLFRDYASVCRSTISSLPSLRYIAEPGRFFATNAFDLFVPVIGKKPALNDSGWRYTIDESLYGQFSCIPFDQQTPFWIRIPKDKDEKIRKSSPGILFGRTCDSLDLIAKSTSMEELEVGDWLWFPNMGAYTSVTASEFNGFPKPPVYESKDSLPSPSDLSLKGRLPYDVTTVTPVSYGYSSIPAGA